MTDPGRSALIRYLGDCIRAELRARAAMERAELVYQLRRQRTREAEQQISDYDAGQAKTTEQMQATIRMERRRKNVRRRAA